MFGLQSSLDSITIITDVQKRISHWLKTDTILGQENNNNNINIREHIKQDPNMLFNIKIISKSLRKNYLDLISIQLMMSYNFMLKYH